METIPQIDCIKIGYLQKPHGVFGTINLYFDEEFEEAVEAAQILFVKTDGLLVPFFVENGNPEIMSAKRALVKFKWIDSTEKAREFSGCEVFMKKEELTIKTKSVVEVCTGYNIFDPENKLIGEVVEINNFSGNVVLTVLNKKEEILIPFNKDLILNADEKNKTLQMIIPKGLVP